jgi:DNA-binding transcriptional LysR family regulator
MKAHPRVAIHLEYHRFDDIYRLLRQEKIDLGIVAYPEKRTNIESIPYGTDELVLVTAPGHALASRRSIRMAALKGLPFIAFEEGMPTRLATDKALKEAGVAADIRMTNDNIYTLKKAVEAGLGVAIVPAGTVAEEAARGTLTSIRIRGTDTTRPLALLKRRQSKLSKPLELFIERLLGFQQYRG